MPVSGEPTAIHYRSIDISTVIHPHSLHSGLSSLRHIAAAIYVCRVDKAEVYESHSELHSGHDERTRQPSKGRSIPQYYSIIGGGLSTRFSAAITHNRNALAFADRYIQIKWRSWTEQCKINLTTKKNTIIHYSLKVNTENALHCLYYHCSGDIHG